MRRTSFLIQTEVCIAQYNVSVVHFHKFHSWRFRFLNNTSISICTSICCNKKWPWKLIYAHTDVYQRYVLIFTRTSFRKQQIKYIYSHSDEDRHLIDDAKCHYELKPPCINIHTHIHTLLAVNILLYYLPLCFCVFVFVFFFFCCILLLLSR